MNCPNAREMLGSYFDRELDASAEFQLRLHLQECDSCRAVLNRLQALRGMIRGNDLAFEAPRELERRIRKDIHNRDRSPADRWRWGALAATVLIASALSVRLIQYSQFKGQSEERAISSHVRALMTGHTTDVLSSDRHTVKPWFTGRIDFSPPVNDLSAQGFPLVGGRIDYLNDERVAALVYQRRKHIIDLFVWPSARGDRTVRESSRGFNVISWSNGGMSFAAVSDLNQLELEQFRNLLSAN